MTYTQAIIVTMLVVSWMRHQARHRDRASDGRPYWRALLGEVLEGVGILVFYGFLWWLWATPAVSK